MARPLAPLPRPSSINDCGRCRGGRGGWRGTLRLWAMALVVLFVAAAPVSMAEAAPSAKDRYRARKIAGEALDLYRAGDYEPALKRFREAYELVPVPTISLRIARCLDELDRMQEAIDTYRQIISTELPLGAPAKHRKARQEAVEELAPLLEKQPTLSVVVVGQETAGVVVKIDGEVVPDALDEPRKMDPGRYEVEAALGERKVSERVMVGRGEHPEVRLQLPDPPVVAPPPEEESSPLPAVGWTLVGTGAAALVAGAVMGGVVVAREDGLAERCPGRVCPPEAHDDARAFDRLRYASTSMLVIGGLAAAVGSTLLLLPVLSGDEEAASGDGAAEPEAEARLMVTPLLQWGGMPADASQGPGSGAMLLGMQLGGTF